MKTRSPLISIIIPCYNQAHFLAEAIESALNQNYPNIEIIVIDDGSIDKTAGIAATYKVIYLFQENLGRSAARNIGIAQSTGEGLIFLDADDRLLPSAVLHGVKSLIQNDEYGFSYGRYRLIGEDGFPKPFWQQLSTSPRLPLFRRLFFSLSHVGTRILLGAPLVPTKPDPFESLLRWNHIAMLSTVLFRRTALEALGGFDSSLSACEDYDLYLRFARTYPIVSHPHIISEYRLHETNTIRNRTKMLDSALTVLERQAPYVTGEKRLVQAYQRGERFWRYHYTRPNYQEVLRRFLRSRT